jgi:hypothetical protein
MTCVGRVEEWEHIYILQEHMCTEDTTSEMQSKARVKTEVEFREVWFECVIRFKRIILQVKCGFL